METPENVKDFLNILNEELRDRAEKDFEIMQIMKGRNLVTVSKILFLFNLLFRNLSKKATWIY